MTYPCPALFLDRSVWKDASSGLRKDSRHFNERSPSRSKSFDDPTCEIHVGDSDDADCLEDRLREDLCHANSTGEDLVELLSEIVYHQWIELLDRASPTPPWNTSPTRLFLWNIEESLRRNLDVSRYLCRDSGADQVSGPDWDALLKRAERRAKLASELGGVAARIGTPHRERPIPYFFPRGRSIPYVSRGEEETNTDNDQCSTGRNQALDRISYIGGILLPFSIVSGIFGMEEPFKPGEGMFYVFWAAAVPLTCITLLLIYADKLRQSRVWIRVSGTDTNTAASLLEAGPTTPYLEQAVPFGGIVETDDRTAAEPPGHAPPSPHERYHSRYYSRYGPGSRAERYYRLRDGRIERYVERELGWSGACKTMLRIQRGERLPPSGSTESIGIRPESIRVRPESIRVRPESIRVRTEPIRVRTEPIRARTEPITVLGRRRA